MNGEDTETLLALISSLLHNPIHDQSVLLDALVECDGDVERAAALLDSRSASSSRPSSSRSGPELVQKKTAAVGMKRKSGGLTGWLEKPSASSTPQPKKARSDDGPVKSRMRGGPGPASSRLADFKLRKADNDTSDVLPSLPIDDIENDSPPERPPSTAKAPAESPIKVKNVTNEEFMTILRPPNSTDASRAGPPKQPPLTLTTPDMIAKHVPCTMHTSVLPPELACRLFYTMLDLSRNWDRNKWWLFDRLVESPHKTSFFIRQYPSTEAESVEMDEAAQFWYNGRQTGSSPPFPQVMEEACQYIEKVVNVEMHKRQRFPMEYGGEPPQRPGGSDDYDNGQNVVWRANVAASNCYEGAKEGVGFHTDALTYLGPYPTIASLSLGTTRTFRLREVVPSNEKDTRAARTYNMPLPHNSLTIMHASCQEMFKHAIPPQRTIDLYHPQYPPPEDMRERISSDPSNARINITFRFFRPDYKPSQTPRCKCGVPCILRPDMKHRHALPNDDDSQAPGGSSGKGSPTKGRPLRRDAVAKYWWACYAGAVNEGKGCGMWQVMDPVAEGRGPFAGDV
ncbi:hypothetical protein EIP91_001045 [Steccherinum ochraceum]|uniref:Fe2OG dioxygenase domain-containing protein n=1 Tax=Steccherinum ochraceum TaxID=92696 RepID=A0A4R0REU7_9APHY|nr:hypothetical protein EIP91_001045 [Steccherinum ochraceum]